MHQHPTFTLSKINENNNNNDECKNTRKHLASCTIHSIRDIQQQTSRIYCRQLRNYSALTDREESRGETLNWIGLEHNAADILVRITCMACKAIADTAIGKRLL